jgi:transglutaminase-like putative cysteine protease
LNPGTYTVKTSYGSSPEKNRTLVVTPSSTKTETLLTPLSSALWTGQIFKAKLTNKNTGAPITNQSVIIYVNNVEYNYTTDSNGIVSIPISFNIPKVYPIVFDFPGTSSGTLYKPSSAYKLFYIANPTTDLNYSYPNYPDKLNSWEWTHPPYNPLDISCPDNAYIKSLSNSLAVYNDPLENIVSINNYAGYMAYELYNNNMKNAVETLLSFAGNCVDQTSVFVALARNAEFPTRYVFGTHKYTSGQGHVWGQILIDNIWICIDASTFEGNYITSNKTKYLGNKQGIFNNYYISNYVITHYPGRQVSAVPLI